MKVLLFARSDLRKKPGGDGWQLGECRDFLASKGFAAELLERPDPRVLRTAGVLLLFNLNVVHEHLLLLSAAERLGIPVLLFPIYHSLELYHRCGRFPPYRFLSSMEIESMERLRSLSSACRGNRHRGSALREVILGHRSGQVRLLEACRFVLCSSRAEGESLRADFPGLDPGKLRVVPNFVNPERLGLIGRGRELRRRGTAVLQVGRIEDLKNQLALVHALAGTGLEARFLGRPNPFHWWYVRAFRKALETLPGASHLSEVAAERYTETFLAARVHVQPSWVEAIGQVSLEAMALGCEVVLTKHSHAWEYLGTSARRVDPSDRAALKAAVVEAYGSWTLEGAKRRSEEVLSWGARDVALTALLDALAEL
ncbi:MAG: hypothetical protein A2284_12940 [Deltaproteobacteria bacterium RIFOXYA12_FULL_61_11]|nr:MAG: hypothetical protein A2284_12940 [Deltaproteobacteria bacterium RIFOXYA12_FULL_61_11]